VELWQLRYFTLVAELQSIARASAHLQIAAPAISRTIKSLEDELGTRLFDRDGRGMHLTLSGMTLLGRATQLLRDAEVARQEVSAIGSHLTGEVTIGATPSIIAIAGLHLIKQCLERYPHVRARLTEGYSAYLQNWVVTSAISVAFVNGPIRETPNIASRRVAVERLFAIGDKKHFREHTGGISLHALLSGPLLLPSSANSIRGLIDDAASNVGCHVKTLLEVDSVGLLKQLAGDGIAAAVLPYGAVKQEVDSGLLVAVPIIEPEIHSELHVISSASHPPGPAANALARLFEDVLVQFAEADDKGIFVTVPKNPKTRDVPSKSEVPRK